MKRRTAAIRKRLLEIYAECGNITMAARKAGVCRDTHYQWLAETGLPAGLDDGQQKPRSGAPGEPGRRPAETTQAATGRRATSSAAADRHDEPLNREIRLF